VRWAKLNENSKLGASQTGIYVRAQGH
jgi:hypothetical protein